MLTAADRAQMAANRSAMIADRPLAVALRRNETTLPSQTVRIVRAGGSGRSQSSPAGQAATAPVLIVGAVDLDIARGDRLTDAGQLYQVTFVRPATDAGVVAEAELVE